MRISAIHCACITAACALVGILLAGCSRLSAQNENTPSSETVSPTENAFRLETEYSIEYSEPNDESFEVVENRNGEFVFSIGIDDYIDCYNALFKKDNGSNFFTPSAQWKCYHRDSGIHSAYRMNYFYFTPDEQVHSLPTVAVYVPTNADRIQEITVNFDEHSYTESGYHLFQEMCGYPMRVFFPDLPDETVSAVCSEIISLGNQNVFSSDEWYDVGAIPSVLFHKNGIGVYPYFAIGDWERFCIIPVTEELLTDFAQKGVELHEIP